MYSVHRKQNKQGFLGHGKCKKVLYRNFGYLEYQESEGGAPGVWMPPLVIPFAFPNLAVSWLGLVSHERSRGAHG